MASLGVNMDEKWIGLFTASAHNVLQGSDELQRMQRDHTVIVVCCEKQCGGILDAIFFWQFDIVKWRVPEKNTQMFSNVFLKTQQEGPFLLKPSQWCLLALRIEQFSVTLVRIVLMATDMQ